jgi:choline dehydrogenase-like flavoprotein
LIGFGATAGGTPDVQRILLCLILIKAGFLQHCVIRGEMIPNANSYCELDPAVVDQWGIPVLRFYFKWREDELQQARHMQETFKELIETAGGIVTASAGANTNWGIRRGGDVKHEVGSTRMGDDPRKSVLNEYCQAWM